MKLNALKISDIGIVISLDTKSLEVSLVTGFGRRDGNSIIGIGLFVAREVMVIVLDGEPVIEFVVVGETETVTEVEDEIEGL